MRIGNILSRVCPCVRLSVCASVCLSVCLSVQAIAFEPLHIETSFLVLVTSLPYLGKKLVFNFISSIVSMYLLKNRKNQ